MDLIERVIFTLAFLFSSAMKLKKPGKKWPSFLVLKRPISAFSKMRGGNIDWIHFSFVLIQQWNVITPKG